MKPATPYIIEADQYGRWVMRCAVLAHSSSEAVRLMSYLPYNRIRAITATRAREKDLREVNRLLDAAGLRVTNFDPAPQNNTEARQLAAELDEPTAPTAPKITHLTLTGPNCGIVICGAPYKDPRFDYAHAMYAPLGQPDICPACLAEWNAPDDDEPQPDTQPSMTAILDAGNAPVRRVLAGGQISFF